MDVAYLNTKKICIRRVGSPGSPGLLDICQILVSWLILIMGHINSLSLRTLTEYYTSLSLSFSQTSEML